MNPEKYSSNSVNPSIFDDAFSFESSVVDFLTRKFGVHDEWVLSLCAATVSGHIEGNSCLDLSVFEARDRFGEFHTDDDQTKSAAHIERLGRYPELVEVIDPLIPPHESTHRARTPFVVLGNSFFTRRQFEEEGFIAKIISRKTSSIEDAIPDELSSLVDSVLPIVSADTKQNDVGRAVLTKKLIVLTGGPGTGKTYTMIRLIALAMSREMLSGGKLDVAVCAPTGKAAARAFEALSGFVQQEQIGRAHV